MTDSDQSTATPFATSQVPWQIWMVVALLALEGVGNLLSAGVNPTALWWLMAKVLFITGLLKAWKPAILLFLLITAYHALFFLRVNPIAAGLNVLLIGLTLSARHYYWPPGDRL